MLSSARARPRGWPGPTARRCGRWPSTPGGPPSPATGTRPSATRPGGGRRPAGRVPRSPTYACAGFEPRRAVRLTRTFFLHRSIPSAAPTGVALPRRRHNALRQAGSVRWLKSALLGWAARAYCTRLVHQDDLGEAGAVPVVPHVVGDEVVLRVAEEALLVVDALVVGGRAGDLDAVAGLLSVLYSPGIWTLPWLRGSIMMTSTTGSAIWSSKRS